MSYGLCLLQNLLLKGRYPMYRPKLKLGRTNQIIWHAHWAIPVLWRSPFCTSKRPDNRKYAATSFFIVFLTSVIIASFRQMVWDERLEYEFEISTLNTHFVDMRFVDRDESVESIREKSVDAKVPYARVALIANDTFVVPVNHMVGDGW